MTLSEHGDDVVMKGRERKRSRSFALALAGMLGTATISLSAVASAGAAQPHVAPPVFRPDIVTAIGDSVMLDISAALKRDIKNAVIFAQTSQQLGVLIGPGNLLAQLKAHRQMGSVVIIALGTNGTITNPMVDAVMAQLRGARKVVFATNHDQRKAHAYMVNNNRSLKAASLRYPNVVIADWDRLATPHPAWFFTQGYSDGIHLPIDGVGARAYASLLAVAAR